MDEIYEFLKKTGTYYLATVEDGKPKVRPFGTIDLFENNLYIQTGKSKEVSKQISINPYIEICAFNGEDWVRLAAKAIEDNRLEAKKHMLDAYPMLRNNYDENDDNTQVFRLVDCKAILASFSKPAKTFEF